MCYNIPPTFDITTFTHSEIPYPITRWDGTDGLYYVAMLIQNESGDLVLSVRQYEPGGSRSGMWQLPPDTDILRLLVEGYEPEYWEVWNTDDQEWGDRFDNGSLEIKSEFNV